jgi:hypothetical protein
MLEPIGLHIIKKAIDSVWTRLSPRHRNVEREPEPSIYDQVHRLKRVLIAHGLKPAYWPEFFDVCKAPFSIKHSELKSDESLLDWLDNAKLSWVCQTFLIDRDWLNGAGHQPHQLFNFSLYPQKMVETLKADYEKYPVDRSLHSDSVFLLNSQSEKALQDPATRVAIAYGIPICQLGNEILVTRWLVDDSAGGYHWHSQKYQPFIRMYARLAYKAFGMHTKWRLLKNVDFEAFQNGELMIPEVLKKSTRFRADTQPEDYGLLECESAVAKAADSLQPILDKMKELGLPTAISQPRIALNESKGSQL